MMHAYDPQDDAYEDDAHFEDLRESARQDQRDADEEYYAARQAGDDRDEAEFLAWIEARHAQTRVPANVPF